MKQGYGSIVIILYSFFCIVDARFYSLEALNGDINCLIFKTPYYSEEKTLDQGLNDFKSCVFNFQRLLEHARQIKKPVVLIIPDQLEGYTPVCPESPWIEGARTALAWANSYFRFAHLGNVDVRVILIDQDFKQEQIITTVLKIFEKKYIDDPSLSKEEQFEKRIFKEKDFFSQKIIIHNYKLVPWSFTKKNKEAQILSPDLPACPAGKKRFLISGAAGFISSHLVEALLKQKHQVIGLDNFI